jgi:hypothetical protein
VEGEVRVLSEKKNEALANRASGTEDTALLGRKLRAHYVGICCIEALEMEDTMPGIVHAIPDERL